MNVNGQEGVVVLPIAPCTDKSEGHSEWAAWRHLPGQGFPSCPPMSKLNGTGDGTIKHL